MDARIEQKEQIERFIAERTALKDFVFSFSHSMLAKEFSFTPIITSAQKLADQLYTELLSLYGDELKGKKPSFFQPNKERHLHKVNLAKLLLTTVQKQLVTLPQVIFFCDCIIQVGHFNHMIDPDHGNLDKLIKSHTGEIDIITYDIQQVLEQAELYYQGYFLLNEHIKGYAAESEIKKDQNVKLKHDCHQRGCFNVLAMQQSIRKQHDRLFDDIITPASLSSYLTGDRKLNPVIHRQKSIEIGFLSFLEKHIGNPELLMMSPIQKITLMVAEEYIKNFVNSLDIHTKSVIFPSIVSDKKKAADIDSRLVTVEGEEESRLAYYECENPEENPFDVTGLKRDIMPNLGGLTSVGELIRAVERILNQYEQQLYKEIPIDQGYLDDTTKRMARRRALQEHNPHISLGQWHLFKAWQTQFQAEKEELLITLRKIEPATKEMVYSGRATGIDPTMLGLITHARTCFESLNLIKARALVDSPSVKPKQPNPR